MQVAAARTAGQRVEVQRHRYEHPLAEMPDRGHEDRAPGQAAIKLRLGDMLVFEAEPVQLESRPPSWSCASIIDLPPPEIAADRIDRDRIVARDEAGLDQRPDQPDAPVG